MRIQDIRDLIKLLEQSEVSEIEVRRWWGHVRGGGGWRSGFARAPQQDEARDAEHPGY